MLTAADFSNSDLGMNPYSLKFVNKKLEKSYKQILIKSNKLYIKVIYFLLLAIFGGYTLGAWIIPDHLGKHDGVLGFVRLIFIIFFLFAGIILFTRYIDIYYERIAFGVMSSSI